MDIDWFTWALGALFGIGLSLFLGDIDSSNEVYNNSCISVCERNGTEMVIRNEHGCICSNGNIYHSDIGMMWVRSN